MKYECLSCKKDVELELTSRIVCPYCGYRILRKKRQGTKHVKAR